MHRHHRSRIRQQGFTMLELAFVAIIMLFLSVIAIPGIKNYLISATVPEAGEDLREAITQLRQQAELVRGANRFASVPSVEQIFRDSSFRIDGNLVYHGLGHQSGQIVLSRIGTGVGAQITLYGVGGAACPALATTLARTATAISIGQSGTSDSPTAPASATSMPSATSTTIVKTKLIPYDAAVATTKCESDGYHNFIRFFVDADA